MKLFYIFAQIGSLEIPHIFHGKILQIGVQPGGVVKAGKEAAAGDGGAGAVIAHHRVGSERQAQNDVVAVAALDRLGDAVVRQGLDALFRALKRLFDRISGNRLIKVIFR